MDGGLTFSPPVQVNNAANTFDPEPGPDRFGNHTHADRRVQRLALVNGTAYAVGPRNTATAQQIVFDKFSVGYTVAGSTPAAGSLVMAPPVDFVIRLAAPVNPATVQASDLTVNGLAADFFALNDAGNEVTFHFNSSPVTVEGPQSMAIAAGAMTSQGGVPLLPFSASFRYDPLPLAVTSTSPPAGGAFTLPAPFTYDLTFSEAFDPASLQAADLVLSGMVGAAVTGVAARDGNTTARFTSGGVTGEGA